MTIISEKLSVGSVDDVSVSATPRKWQAHFVVDGVDFVFEASTAYGTGDWFCEFRPTSAVTDRGGIDWDKAYGNSGAHGGNSTAVFVKVLGITKHFLATVNPKSLNFSGSIDPRGPGGRHGRGTLYQKIARAYSSELSAMGYAAKFHLSQNDVEITVEQKKGLAIREMIDLLEAPLDSYEVHGDFDQPGSHVAKDRKLLASPKHPARLAELLRAGPYKIAVHVANISRQRLASLGHHGPPDGDGDSGENLLDFSELGGEFNLVAGEYSTDGLAQYGITVSPKPDCINFVVAGNVAGEHSLSAWMLMHRLTHMVEDAMWHAPKRLDPALAKAWGNFSRYCVKSVRNGNGNFLANLEELATMKSALKNANVELANEFLVQFWVKGRCPLRRDRGLPEEQVAGIEKEIAQHCQTISNLMVGRVYFSF